MYVCVRACVRACVRVCVCACVRACVCVTSRTYSKTSTKRSHIGLAYSSTGRTGRLVCCIFQPHVGDLDGATDEAQGLVGFAADISDMGVPTEARGDRNTNVFCLRFCAKDVTVELVL